MRKKKTLIVGIAIGLLARPVIKRAPFRNMARDVIRTRLYNLAVDYIENFDAERPS